MKITKSDIEAVAVKPSQYPPDNLKEIAFAGRSNVGKSSLLNLLTGRKKLAKVSGSPGKTRTINFYVINDEFRIVDLPGYGYAKVSKAEKERWARLVEGYLSAERNIKLIVQIIDIRHKPTKDDYDMLSFLYNSNAPFVIALTKKDKLKKTAYEKRIDEVIDELQDYEGIQLIPFSAVDGTGVDEMKEVIEEYITEEE